MTRTAPSTATPVHQLAWQGVTLTHSHKWLKPEERRQVLSQSSQRELTFKTNQQENLNSQPARHVLSQMWYHCVGRAHPGTPLPRTGVKCMFLTRCPTFTGKQRHLLVPSKSLRPASLRNLLFSVTILRDRPLNFTSQ